MYGSYGMRRADRGVAYARRPRGRSPLAFAPLLFFAGFLTLASAGSFFPLIPLFFVLFFFVAPMIGRSAARGLGSRGTPAPRPVGEGEEKELLRALERNEEITAARAALETSLGVTEADKMLAKLAAGGHLEVRAREGHLTYALRAADRVDGRGASPKDIETSYNARAFMITDKRDRRT